VAEEELVVELEDTAEDEEVLGIEDEALEVLEIEEEELGVLVEEVAELEEELELVVTTLEDVV